MPEITGNRQLATGKRNSFLKAPLFLEKKELRFSGISSSFKQVC
jgi:hypothetical protein